MPLWARDADSSQTMAQRRRWTMTFAGALLIVLLIPVFLLTFGGDNNPSQVLQAGSSWVKPQGLTVVALVFYGRRQNVQILERYLRVCLDLADLTVA
jgi:Na+-driven multidrug efflux pump